MADENKAIEAFNCRLIDKYLKKSDENLIEKLKEFTLEMSVRYFTKITDSITLTSPSLSILADPSFIEFFNNLIISKAITEYFLIDNIGSFLLNRHR